MRVGRDTFCDPLILKILHNQPSCIIISIMDALNLIKVGKNLTFKTVFDYNRRRWICRTFYLQRLQKYIILSDPHDFIIMCHHCSCCTHNILMSLLWTNLEKIKWLYGISQKILAMETKLICSILIKIREKTSRNQNYNTPQSQVPCIGFPQKDGSLQGGNVLGTFFNDRRDNRSHVRYSSR